MAVRGITTTIGGHEWSTNTLPATAGLKVITRISRIIGGGLAGIPSGMSLDSDALTGADVSELGPMIAALTERLADDDTVDTVRLLLSDLHKDRHRVDFDGEFSGNYGVLIDLIGWAVRENFGSFLRDSPRLAALAQLAGSASTGAT